MNNNKIIGTVFLDVAKAFNCINHTVLYNKMYLAGFSHKELVQKLFDSLSVS